MRFVILFHQTSAGSHYDLMLEMDSALLTWQLAEWPIATGNTVFATRLPDHRKIYLDYEGEISGQRGTVKRVENGTYTEISENQFLLNGQQIYGVITLAVPV